MLMLPLGMNSGALNEASIRVIVSRPVSGGHDHLAEPDVFYYPASKVLTIEFAVEDFEPYTLSVESSYNTLDYYVTTPLMSLYISPDVVSVNLSLETDGGDVYWGSFEATASINTD